MKLIASLALSLALLGAFTACSKEPPRAAPKTAATPSGPKVAQVWICPMDKEVVSPQPGSCPKCGMHLELKE